MFRPSPTRPAGSVLLVTVLSLLVLAVLVGQVMMRVTSRSLTAHRSLAWNAAMTTAASAVDMTIADLTSLLPDVRIGSSGVALGSPSLPLDLLSSLKISTNGLNLTEGITLSLQPQVLQHQGEGIGRQEASVFIDVLPLQSILSSVPLSLNSLTGVLSNPQGLLSGGLDLQLVRLRARGRVAMGANRRPDEDPQDLKLRRPTLVWDRLTGKRATEASVTREIEVLLRPVLPFESAVTTSGRLHATAVNSRFDSFNSLLPLTSTWGRYDASKRLKGGHVTCGGADVKLAGMVYGDVRTNGGNVTNTPQISGTIDNRFSQPLPQLATPGWTKSFPQTSTPGGSVTLSAGSALVPARYRFGSINGTLRITRGLLGLGTDAEIYIAGDVTGSLQIDPGVRVKVYLAGNLRMSAGRLVNGNGIASSLQIFGVGDDTSAGPRGIELELGDVAAAIYAPSHHVVLTGDGSFSGAITCATFTAAEAVQVHYDEALGLNIGPVLRYAVAAWVERKI